MRQRGPWTLPIACARRYASGIEVERWGKIVGRRIVLAATILLASLAGTIAPARAAAHGDSA
ncbi:MAG TPA: hypothetical protein VF221_13905, partial [Chloroflexota bacterium]